MVSHSALPACRVNIGHRKKISLPGKYYSRGFYIRWFLISRLRVYRVNVEHTKKPPLPGKYYYHGFHIKDGFSVRVARM